jgi:hypothetical protein
MFGQDCCVPSAPIKWYDAVMKGIKKRKEKYIEPESTVCARIDRSIQGGIEKEGKKKQQNQSTGEVGHSESD